MAESREVGTIGRRNFSWKNHRRRIYPRRSNNRDLRICSGVKSCSKLNKRDIVALRFNISLILLRSRVGRRRILLSSATIHPTSYDSICFPRKPATVCASLCSVSENGAPLSDSRNTTAPETSPSAMIGAAIPAWYFS